MIVRWYRCALSGYASTSARGVVPAFMDKAASVRDTDLSEPVVGMAVASSGFCENSRDAYLRYTTRAPQRENRVIHRGRHLYEAWTRTVSAVKKALYAVQNLSSTAQLNSELLGFEASLKESAVQRYQLLLSDRLRWLAKKIIAEAE
ncbi:MAG: hypothetical protein QXG48_02920 [Thermofilaceae archaeon]